MSPAYWTCLCAPSAGVYMWTSCFTPYVRRDCNPDGILNAAFHVVSFSRLVHPSLVCHLVPSQPVIGKFTLQSKRSWSSARAFPEVCTTVSVHSLTLLKRIHSYSDKWSSQGTWSLKTDTMPLNVGKFVNHKQVQANVTSQFTQQKQLSWRET